MMKVGYIYDAKVIRVVDGDTLDLNVDLGFDIWHKIRCRLYDIDTPEIYGQHAEEKGKEAKEFVIKWIPIDVMVVIDCRSYNARGKYGRALVDVYRPKDDVPLNQALYDAGLAKEYKM